ncbi:MAG: hypothetical protein HY939_01110 [Gammaproteobacteria bacterium]|nr:hypothetical protein [Gammaproteobacteria bacterium]
MRLRDRLLRLDNYRWALLLGFLFALPLLIILLILGPIAGVLLVPDWLVCLFFVPSFLGSFAAATSYIGRLVDGFANWRKQPSTLFSRLAHIKNIAAAPYSRLEISGTLIGALFGVSITISLALLGAVIPGSSFLPYALACLIFGLANINTFSGLGNRLGASLGALPFFFNPASTNPYDKMRLRTERIVMLLAILAGLIIALSLVFSMGFGLIPIGGLTAFFVGGGIPFGLSGALFTLSFTSALVSATDYFSRAGSFAKLLILKRFFKNKKDKILDMENRLMGRTHEYRGALVGVSLGIALAILAITLLLLMQPLTSPIALLMVFVVATSILGGLSSRIGRFIDGLVARDTPALTPPASSASDLPPPVPPSASDIPTNISPLPGLSYEQINDDHPPPARPSSSFGMILAATQDLSIPSSMTTTNDNKKSNTPKRKTAPEELTQEQPGKKTRYFFRGGSTPLPPSPHCSRKGCFEDLTHERAPAQKVAMGF